MTLVPSTGRAGNLPISLAMEITVTLRALSKKHNLPALTVATKSMTISLTSPIWSKLTNNTIEKQRRILFNYQRYLNLEIYST